MLVPLYIAEVSPPKIRGRLVGIYEVGVQAGTCVGFWINYGLKVNMAPSTSQWMIPFAIQLIPGGILIIGMLFLPDSPRYDKCSDRVRSNFASSNIHSDGMQEPKVEKWPLRCFPNSETCLPSILTYRKRSTASSIKSSMNASVPLEKASWLSSKSLCGLEIATVLLSGS